MRTRIQITIETEGGQHVEEVACWERQEHRVEDIGLTLADSKSLVAGIQKNSVATCTEPQGELFPLNRDTNSHTSVCSFSKCIS